MSTVFMMTDRRLVFRVAGQRKRKIMTPVEIKSTMTISLKKFKKKPKMPAVKITSASTILFQTIASMAPTKSEKDIVKNSWKEKVVG